MPKSQQQNLTIIPTQHQKHEDQESYVKLFANYEIII